MAGEGGWGRSHNVLRRGAIGVLCFCSDSRWDYCFQSVLQQCIQLIFWWQWFNQQHAFTELILQIYFYFVIYRWQNFLTRFTDRHFNLVIYDVSINFWTVGNLASFPRCWAPLVFHSLQTDVTLVLMENSSQPLVKPQFEGWCVYSPILELSCYRTNTDTSCPGINVMSVPRHRFRPL